jgi:UDP-2,3-diacylglucosamine pyrophosphatase LpxH
LRPIIAETIEIDQLKTQTIFAVSDVHLGYRDQRNQNILCNKAEFNTFLNEIRDKKLCNRLIICGDFLDMWRRDLAGVILENVDTLNLLYELKEFHEIDINFVVGNHDYYLRRFKEEDFAYEFSFHPGLKLVDSNEEKREYWFLHGDEFDFILNEIFYDPLCLANDDLGQLAEMAWQIYLQGLNWFERIINIIKGFQKALKEPLIPAETRFGKNVLDMILAQPRNSSVLMQLLGIDDFPPTEAEAIKWAKQQSNLSMLVFGHTHQPFVHIEGNKSIGNTGSWVTASNPERNLTYIMIKGHQQSLCTFTDKKRRKLISSIVRADGTPDTLEISEE